MDIELLTLEELKNISDYMVAKRRGEISESWESIVELLGLDMSKDNFRKASIGADIERRIHELEKANNSTDEEIERLNEKINEYKIERYKWLDTRTAERREDRSKARMDAILELIDYLSEKKNREYPFETIINDNDVNELEGILLISDVHYGMDVSNEFNIFNPEVAVERFNKIANEVVSFSELHRIKKLNIFFLGDLINGLIHMTTKLENKVQVIDQVLDMGEIASSFVNEISNHIKEVEVFFTSGNHDRVNPKKQDNLNSEDFGRIILRTMIKRLKSVDNVTIEQEDVLQIVNTSIMGHKVFAVHGDKDKPTSSVANLSRIQMEVPDYIFMGHFHHVMSEMVGNTMVVANGSFCGDSEYCVNARLTSPPMQKFMIFNDKGKLCEYDIRLD